MAGEIHVATDDSDALDQVVAVLRERKKIVVIAGAGISVSAGIPAFRSADGPFKNWGKDVFDISVYNDGTSTTKFHALLRTLFDLSSRANPTPFHHLLASLAKQGRLRRLFTQNIDELDVQMAPLNTDVPLRIEPPYPVTVQLHGTLRKMVCVSCRCVQDMDISLLEGPEAPLCDRCESNEGDRLDAGKRSHGVGRLRPRLVLYGDGMDHPDADAIGYVHSADLRAVPDAVIVAGTSASIPSVQHLVRSMCEAARQQGGIAAWINIKPPPAGLKDCFDLVVQRPCDEVAELVSLPRWDEGGEPPSYRSSKCRGKRQRRTVPSLPSKSRGIAADIEEPSDPPRRACIPATNMQAVLQILCSYGPLNVRPIDLTSQTAIYDNESCQQGLTLLIPIQLSLPDDAWVLMVVCADSPRLLGPCPNPELKEVVGKKLAELPLPPSWRSPTWNILTQDDSDYIRTSDPNSKFIALTYALYAVAKATAPNIEPPAHLPFDLWSDVFSRLIQAAGGQAPDPLKWDIVSMPSAVWGAQSTYIQLERNQYLVDKKKNLIRPTLLKRLESARHILRVLASLSAAAKEAPTQEAYKMLKKIEEANVYAPAEPLQSAISWLQSLDHSALLDQVIEIVQGGVENLEALTLRRSNVDLNIPNGLVGLDMYPHSAVSGEDPVGLDDVFAGEHEQQPKKPPEELDEGPPAKRAQLEGTASALASPPRSDAAASNPVLEMDDADASLLGAFLKHLHTLAPFTTTIRDLSAEPHPEHGNGMERAGGPTDGHMASDGVALADAPHTLLEIDPTRSPMVETLYKVAGAKQPKDPPFALWKRIVQFIVNTRAGHTCNLSRPYNLNKAAEPLFHLLHGECNMREAYQRLSEASKNIRQRRKHILTIDISDLRHVGEILRSLTQTADEDKDLGESTAALNRLEGMKPASPDLKQAVSSLERHIQKLNYRKDMLAVFVQAKEKIAAELRIAEAELNKINEAEVEAEAEG